jgi:hypothetical protein
VSVFSVGNTLYAKGPLLDEGQGSGGFSITNSYNPPLGSLGSSGGSSDPPLWQQILGGLGNLSSILDPYIFTEQERAQIELQKALALAEAERARAQAAAIAKEKAQVNWFLVAGLVLGGGLILYLLLRE